MPNPTLHKNQTRSIYHIQARKYRIEVGTRTRIMGIINLTPDSFSQDGCLASPGNPVQKAVRLGKSFLKEGADILDVGGESTRPGSLRVSVKEEINRIIPSIRQLAKTTRVPISVDTYKPAVAKHALDAGASIVNNIKGILLERSLLKMVKHYNAAIVIMHMKGTPRSMQKNVCYTDLFDEILGALQHSVEICLDIGIKSDKIIIDPGIGFGKTLSNNLEIVHQLWRLKTLNLPILIGTSRKSFIGKTLDKDVKYRLMGTAATVCASILNGAHIVRIHDIRELKDLISMSDAIVNENVSTRE